MNSKRTVDSKRASSRFQYQGRHLAPGIRRPQAVVLLAAAQARGQAGFEGDALFRRAILIFWL